MLLLKRIMICTSCNEILDNDTDICPICGSQDIINQLFASDTLAVDFYESVRGKVKYAGEKRPAKEFLQGDDFSVRLQKYVDKIRIIDRKEDKYYERVVDKESGEVIHECSGALTDHIGHGYAKVPNK